MAKIDLSIHFWKAADVTLNRLHSPCISFLSPVIPRGAVDSN